jgi:hypothetical protein
MRQTTVLIAQLTASGGIRAPMSRLADEIFLTLSDELESQGVSRKVVADMFGMALRGYQRRVQRLRASSMDANTTLWETVLDYVEKEGPVRKRAILDRFASDDPDAVRSVLKDLITSGLVLRQGRGAATQFVALEEEHRRALARKGSRELVETMVWLDLSHHPGSTREELIERLTLDPDAADGALGALQAAGRVKAGKDGTFVARSMTIPIGAESGWEAAVFDHFQAVCAALVAKLRRGNLRSRGDDTTGGLTVTFDVHDEHPELQRVLALLDETVQRVDQVWDAVERYNETHPVEPDTLRQVTFYAGQFRPDDAENEH